MMQKQTKIYNSPKYGLARNCATCRDATYGMRQKESSLTLIVAICLSAVALLDHVYTFRIFLFQLCLGFVFFFIKLYQCVFIHYYGFYVYFYCLCCFFCSFSLSLLSLNISVGSAELVITFSSWLGQSIFCLKKSSLYQMNVMHFPLS